jgi:hypothetical protein
MKRLLLLAVAFSLFTIVISSQIQSTTVGGYWNVPLPDR